jgi:cobalt-zinc-cadmium efflux system outer membrane protein
MRCSRLILILASFSACLVESSVLAGPEDVASSSASGTQAAPQRGGLPTPGGAAGAFPRTRKILGWLRRSEPQAGSESEVPPKPVRELPSMPGAKSQASETVDGTLSSPVLDSSRQGARSSTASRHPTPLRDAVVDAPVRRAQAAPGELQMPMAPAVSPPTSASGLFSGSTPMVGGQSIALQAALYGTLTSNPDLATLRLGNPTTPSAEAVEVARHFPTTLNPTLWCDLRPITLIPPDPFGGASQRGRHGFYQFGQFYFYLSLRQPIELGHQTTHRYNIAKAAFEQQKWTVMQAELLALIQTYRFFQTAAYRRERLKIATELAEFNEKLQKTLERRLEANQVPAADVVLARVESRATRQLVKAAQQDYITALTDLRNQVGIPEAAGAAEPLGEFTLPPYIPPAREEDFIEMALQSRPDIHAAQAQIMGTKAAENLARGDRIPSPIIGPQYEIDEAGLQYIGFVYITPIPILNSGTPLVRQRQADHHRAHIALQSAQQRAVAQVRAALAKWNGASELIKETGSLTAELAREVGNLERLFDQGQTDLGRLMQAQQRLIQLKTAEVDAVWAATQAQADLLLALGAPALIQGMLNQAESAAVAPASGPAPPTPPVSSPSPFQAAATRNEPAQTRSTTR